MGIDAAFDDGEFNEIIKDVPLRFSQVKHRAMVEVTKDGTEGADAVQSYSRPRNRRTTNLQLPKVINIDQPFLFFIRDTVLKTLLIAGKHTNLEPNLDQQC